MQRRVCMASVSNGCLDLLLHRLPDGVKEEGRRECFDRDVTILRLEGDGLPDWCEATEGSTYVWATITINNHGTLKFFPSPDPNQDLGMGPQRRIIEQYGYPN